MKKNARARFDDGDVPTGLVGCAGWSLNTDVAASFPAAGSHLERYARVFPCVEINSSFYRAHQPKTYARWADSVPETFRFSVKMARTITHESRLDDCEEALFRFVEETSHLGNKLGCILVQLPPSLAFDAKIAKRFFAGLRKATPVAVACEPRHASWFTAAGDALLRSADIAFVQADPPPVAAADDRRGEPSTLYIRLHGSPKMYYSAYDDAFIATVAARMRLAREQNRTAWCIFDNTARGAAIPNALALMDRLTAVQDSINPPPPAATKRR